MRNKRLLGQILVIGALAAASFSWAQAPVPATSPSGIQYVSGGVGLDEREAMQAQKDLYSVSLATALKRSGEYLSGVQIRILDARSRAVLVDHTMDGPWFFAALEPGQYEVEATYERAGAARQVRRNIIKVTSGASRRLVFHFDG